MPEFATYRRLDEKPKEIVSNSYGNIKKSPVSKVSSGDECIGTVLFVLIVQPA